MDVNVVVDKDAAKRRAKARTFCTHCSMLDALNTCREHLFKADLITFNSILSACAGNDAPHLQQDLCLEHSCLVQVTCQMASEAWQIALGVFQQLCSQHRPDLVSYNAAPRLKQGLSGT